jgi:hypothetical protein
MWRVAIVQSPQYFRSDYELVINFETPRKALHSIFFARPSSALIEMPTFAPTGQRVIA